MDKEENSLQITKGEIAKLDETAKQVITYSQDDRLRADDLYTYYQSLIANGDTKGETRIALAKSLELREMSVNNLIEVLKLKTRLMEKQLLYEIKRQDIEHSNLGGGIGRRNGGYDTTSLITDIDREVNEDEEHT
jgi:hypothetical protein